MKKVLYESNTYYYKIIEIENIEFVFISTSNIPLDSAIVHLFASRYYSILEALYWFHKNKEKYKNNDKNY